MWLYTDRANPNLNRKFQSFWSGPYRVTRILASTLFEIESYGRWTKEKIVTSASINRLKKCFIADPDTNLGIPVELTAADVRPYFEHQDLLGRIPTSDFAPHILDKEQQLPLSLPADQPRDVPPIVSPEARSTTTPATEPAFEPTPAPEPDALQLPTDVTPVEEPMVTVEPISEPVPEPAPSRRRGRPLGSKNKPRPCPNCTASTKCVVHCEACKSGLGCTLHTARQCCPRCTRTRPCEQHR